MSENSAAPPIGSFSAAPAKNPAIPAAAITITDAAALNFFIALLPLSPCGFQLMTWIIAYAGKVRQAGRTPRRIFRPAFQIYSRRDVFSGRERGLFLCCAVSAHILKEFSSSAAISARHML